MTLQVSARTRVATPAALANGSGRGSYTVVGGVLAWDPRFDAVPANMIPLRRGGLARVGSYAAALDVYELAVRLRAEINRLNAAFAAAAPGWTLGSPVPPAASELLTVVVNAEIQWGTLLRVLGALYHAAGLPTSARPRAVARAGIDLRRIRFWGVADPLSQGHPVWIESNRPAAWSALGAAIVARWLDAYPERARPPLSGARELAADLQRQHNALEAEMGFALPWFAVLAVLIVGIGAAVVVYNKTLGAVAAFAGLQLDYYSALNDQLADSFDECQDGDQAACERWREIAGRIEGINPPLAGFGRLALVAAVALGGYWLVTRRG